MKRKIQFIPHAGTVPPMPQDAQDALRRQVPASTVSFHQGQPLLSREGVLYLADGIISGRIVGNVEAARTMKAEVLAKYPAPDGRQ